MLGKGLGFRQAAGQRMGLSQGETTERLEACDFRGDGLFRRLCQERVGVGDAPGQGIRGSERRRHTGGKEREVRFLTDAYGAFEPGQGPGEVALAEE